VSKKTIISILLAAIFALAGYFLFNWYRGSSAAWKYIPSNAVVVISSEHLQDSAYVATEAGVDLKRLPLLDIASDNLSLLNLISADPKKLHEFLKGKSISYSFHPRTSTELGVIMYIPIHSTHESAWLNNPNHNEKRVLHHSFQDQRITDVSDSNSRPLLSFMIRDEFLIVSYYGDLIEDVVRASSLSIESFPLRFRFAKIPDSDYGTSLYLKKDAWKSIVPINSDKSPLAEFLNAMPDFQDLHLDKTSLKTSLRLSSSSGSTAPGYYLTAWTNDNTGLPFKNHKHISQQTSFFFRFAAENDANFKKQYLKWHGKNKSDAWDRVIYYIGKESNLLPTNVSSEVVLCQLEENNSINDGKILLAQFTNYEKLRPVLQKLARLSAKESNSSADQFQGYDIYSIDIPELPTGLFGPMFTGFPRSYITYIAPYLVVSNNAQVLQNYIVDYENQLTWKQSPEFDSVLISSKSDAQLAMVVNLRKAQSTLINGGKTYGDLSGKIETVLVECRYQESDAFASVTLIPKKRQTANKVLNRTFLNLDIEWPEIYDSKLAALQNPVDGSSEILLTDVEHNLLRTTNLKTGKTQTITKLDGAIATSAYKVDFLNIGRQQRVLATANQIYAIDEDDSSTITRFSKSLPSASPIKDLFLIDGGREGSNRFIIKNTDQELFLWESVSKSIRRLNRTMRFENIHSPVVTLNQIGNRGFIVTERNGKVYLLSENGSVRRGFPVDILTRAESPFTWTQNPVSGQPELVGVSASGELIRISLDGRITTRRQLLRPEPGSTFRIIFDRNSLDWMLLRSSSSKASIITKEGDEVFTIKDIMPNAVIQYHFFGVDNRFITILSGHYSTVFDMNGKRLGDKAIPSEMPVQLTYQPGYYKLLIFSRSEKKIQVWSIKLR
jgi:hypothetical protein